MTALSKITEAGFIVTLVNGGIDVTPTKAELTASQFEYIKSHKQEIIKQLSGTQLQHGIRERLEERAAIMEYDGGLTRKDAEQAAAAAIRVYYYRTTEKPNSELVAIMPGVELDEATASLKLRYGDRLLAVYPMPSAGTTKH